MREILASRGDQNVASLGHCHHGTTLPGPKGAGDTWLGQPAGDPPNVTPMPPITAVSPYDAQGQMICSFMNEGQQQKKGSFFWTGKVGVNTSPGMPGINGATWCAKRVRQIFA